MDIKELESFFMVAKLRSFSKASQALQIGQPAATKHIRKLESELGRTLFQRDERPIQLTAAGAHLFRIAAPLVEGIRTFAQQTSDQQQSRVIRVACTHGFMSDLLLSAVKSFRERHPHQRLRIRLGTKPEVLDMVLAGNADFGIAPSPDRLKTLSFIPLTASERVVIAPPKHPLLSHPLESLDQIAGYPLILLGYRTQTRILLEAAFSELGVAYEVALELDSMEMVKRYIELGLGIGIGHRIALDAEDYRTLRIIPLGKFLPSELVGIASRRGRELPEPASEFISVIREKVKAAESVAGQAGNRVRKA
jgi:DNA-binding transcriptional LysR family regulator